MTSKPIAVLWPDEENYARFREISEGIKSRTVQAYRNAVSQDLESKERAGIHFERIAFDVEELLAYARSEGADRVTSQIRAAFALQIQLERHWKD